MNSGKYAEAVTEFDSLNRYKDSADLSRKANAKSLNTGKVKAGDIIRFGDYKGHTNWRVLTVNGSEAYITTVDSVDSYPFDASWCGWDAKDCDIKIWLNDKYMNAAFTDYEKEIIVEKEGLKVFLLSIEEAYRYFKDNEDRVIPINDELGYWLRSKGIYADHAAFINSGPVGKGGIDEYGGQVFWNRGVRPALWIKTDSMNSGATDATETITESGYFRFRKTGSETELIGLTKEGTKQEELVIPAGVKIFGRVVDGFSSESLKGVSFESDDDVDYGYLVAGSRTLEKIKLPAKLTAKVPFLLKLQDAFSIYRGYKKAFLLSGLDSIWLQISSIAIHYAYFQAVGVPVDLATITVFMTITITVSMLPISINGIGIREGVNVSLFTGLLGIPADIVLAAALIGYIPMLFQAAQGAFVFAIIGKRNSAQ